MKFEKLFEPISIGKVDIKNRIAMAPMVPGGMVNRDGGPTQRAMDYYAERAFGGVGLIITGCTEVSDLMEPRTTLMFVNPASCSAFSELAESVHYYGTRIFVQLTAGLGSVIVGPTIDGGFRPVSASAISAFWRPNVVSRALTTDEVEEIVDAFGKAAELLKTAGIDGIELHGHEGYLFDQFTTAIWNKRNDKYGGSLEDRLRFPIEALNAIKDRAGKDFPVVYRYGLKHYMKGPGTGALPHEDYVEVGRDVAEGLEMAKLLEKAGFDGLHVDAGSYESWYWAHPPIYQSHGCMVDMAAEAKKCVTIPVIAVGRLGIPELAEKVVAEGKADMVALGRALLADPHWPKKAHQGRVEEICPCIGCHDGCLYRELETSKHISCAVNPVAGRERLYALQMVAQPQKVLIAGGGVAGMEAARVAAIRGCEVTLYEKGEKLGGHLIPGSVPDFKQDINRLLDWYNTQLERVGVKIKLQVEVTPEFIRREKPDKVIVATGSTPIVPDVPGIEKPIVTSCIDLLLGRKKTGEIVVVIGGGLVGCETALWLANQGKRVSIVEILPEIPTGDMCHANQFMLLDLLKNKEVEFMTNTSLEAVMDEGVNVVDRNFTRKTVLCDTVALALGLKPERGLYESLRRECTELYLIGDCKEPHNIMQAIWDGYHIASR